MKPRTVPADTRHVRAAPAPATSTPAHHVPTHHKPLSGRAPPPLSASDRHTRPDCPIRVTWSVRLGIALEGDGIRAIADAFSQLSAITRELADAIDLPIAVDQQPSATKRRTG